MPSQKLRKSAPARRRGQPEIRKKEKSVQRCSAIVDPEPTCTSRQVECLRWIAEGKSDWEIGQILNISHKTVNYHVEQVKERLGVSTRIQAVVQLVRSGKI